MESSATDCKEMSRGEHANRHDVRFVANLARNLGGCDQDIFGKISRSRTSLKGSSVIVTVTRTIRFVTGERRLHCQMPYLRLPMKIVSAPSDLLYHDFLAETDSKVSTTTMQTSTITITLPQEIHGNQFFRPLSTNITAEVFKKLETYSLPFHSVPYGWNVMQGNFFY